MMIHDVLREPLGEILMTIWVMLLGMRLVLIFGSFRDGRSRRVLALYGVYFLTGFAVFYLLMLDIRWIIDDFDEVMAVPGVLAVFRKVPVAVGVGYEILAALILLAGLLDMHSYRMKNPTFESIKETMDLLPAGIAFGTEDGKVVFSNLAMNDLARAVTGRGFITPDFFRELVHAQGSQIRLPDGAGVRQIVSETVDVGGESYIQLTATDITEEAAGTRELEEKNKKLREIHMRLDIYNKQADRIVLAQEVLTARMAVHNEVGNVLLETRHYLTDPGSFDENLLLRALRNTNTYLLREYEQDDTARDPLIDALEMAESIGVDVTITGVIPGEESLRKVLAAAINECATNTIKHADGDELSVDIEDEDMEIRYLLRSNGTPPDAEIREAGGLLSLRTLVEHAGGTMTTSAHPTFELRIILQTKGPFPPA